MSGDWEKWKGDGSKRGRDDWEGWNGWNEGKNWKARSNWNDRDDWKRDWKQGWEEKAVKQECKVKEEPQTQFAPGTPAAAFNPGTPAAAFFNPGTPAAAFPGTPPPALGAAPGTPGLAAPGLNPGTPRVPPTPVTMPGTPGVPGTPAFGARFAGYRAGSGLATPVPVQQTPPPTSAALVSLRSAPVSRVMIQPTDLRHAPRIRNGKVLKGPSLVAKLPEPKAKVSKAKVPDFKSWKRQQSERPSATPVPLQPGAATPFEGLGMGMTPISGEVTPMLPQSAGELYGGMTPRCHTARVALRVPKVQGSAPSQGRCETCGGEAHLGLPEVGPEDVLGIVSSSPLATQWREVLLEADLEERPSLAPLRVCASLEAPPSPPLNRKIGASAEEEKAELELRVVADPLALAQRARLAIYPPWRLGPHLRFSWRLEAREETPPAAPAPELRQKPRRPRALTGIGGVSGGFGGGSDSRFREQSWQCEQHELIHMSSVQHET
ncbi:unnamed protein product [Effrenium voratum]|nr:unnamed protein product [Effrenium voratum]